MHLWWVVHRAVQLCLCLLLLSLLFLHLTFYHTRPHVVPFRAHQPPLWMNGRGGMGLAWEGRRGEGGGREKGREEESHSRERGSSSNLAVAVGRVLKDTKLLPSSITSSSSSSSFAIPTTPSSSSSDGDGRSNQATSKHFHLQPNPPSPRLPNTNTTLVQSDTSKSTPPPSLPPPPLTSPPRIPGGGYVVVNKVYEQQTMASGNLLQLQCWASMLNMSVVKPFMASSTLSTPLEASRHTRMLNFGDVFNESHWQEHAALHGYLPLAEWGEWMEKGPRQVIAVQLRYPLLSAARKKRAERQESTHTATSDFSKQGCAFKFILGKNQMSLAAKGFRIVRRVCFNFLNGDEFTLAQFRERLFGRLRPHQVSVVLGEWRGIGAPQRILIREKICNEDHPFRERVRPSGRLVRDAERYAQQYLAGGNYVAVIARFEMTGLTRQVSTSSDNHSEIPMCIKLTLQELKKLRKDAGTNTTFLAVDIGKYGSISFQRKKYFNHFSEMSGFVREVYGGKMGLREVDAALEGVSGVWDAGYIAMLQQLIVTRAKCILFVGGWVVPETCAAHLPAAAFPAGGAVCARSQQVHQRLPTNRPDTGPCG